MDNNAGTTWQGHPCSKGRRQLLEATLDATVSQVLAKFDVDPASVSDVVTQQQRRNLQRQRAMLLCHVDEIEQQLGFDESPDKPRTSEIRQFWKDSGRPPL